MLNTLFVKMLKYLKEETKMMEEVFDEYGRIYETILKDLYPAKNSTGFPERNLSVNFSKAYEKIAATNGQNAISWFEFQFGDKNDLHIDAVIMNTSSKELIFVESKRFSEPAKKIREVGEDIDRIYSCIEELKEDGNDSRINLKKYKKVYGLVLADVWTETPQKKSILKAYNENKFLEEFSTTINSKQNGISSEKYYVHDFDKLPNYHLVSFMWKL